jgi:hypothetical protein
VLPCPIPTDYLANKQALKQLTSQHCGSRTRCFSAVNALTQPAFVHEKEPVLKWWAYLFIYFLTYQSHTAHPSSLLGFTMLKSLCVTCKNDECPNRKQEKFSISLTITTTEPTYRLIYFFQPENSLSLRNNKQQYHSDDTIPLSLALLRFRIVWNVRCYKIQKFNTSISERDPISIVRSKDNCRYQEQLSNCSPTLLRDGDKPLSESLCIISVLFKEGEWVKSKNWMIVNVCRNLQNWIISLFCFVDSGLFNSEFCISYVQSYVSAKLGQLLRQNS